MAKKEVYTVEEIKDSRMVNGKVQYLIKWEGYEDIHNSWEFEKDIFCKDMIVEFENKKTGGKKKVDETKTDEKKKKKSVSKGGKEEEGVFDENYKAMDFYDEKCWDKYIKKINTVQKYKNSPGYVVEFEDVNGKKYVVATATAHEKFSKALCEYYESHIVFYEE